MSILRDVPLASEWAYVRGVAVGAFIYSWLLPNTKRWESALGTAALVAMNAGLRWVDRRRGLGV